MNLKNILDGIEGLKAKGELDLEIEGIESNSKKNRERIFVCCNKRVHSRWTRVYW